MGTHLAEELPGSTRARWWWSCSSPPTMQQGLDRLERRAAFSRAVAAAGACVLPAQFDDRELPGLLPDVVAVDPRRYTPTQFADLIVAKLADLAISPAPSGGGRRAGCRWRRPTRGG